MERRESPECQGKHARLLADIQKGEGKEKHIAGFRSEFRGHLLPDSGAETEGCTEDKWLALEIVY